MAATQSHGVPVHTSRLYTSGLSRNAANTDWNYIAGSYAGGTPVEWNVVKNLTGAGGPTSQATYQTPNGKYPNNVIGYTTGIGQILASNGRIFWPLYQNYTAYYDPTTESVGYIGPFAESPPVDPNASTAPYSFCFDTSGVLYFATQESQERPSCIVATDTNALTQSVLGYVGSGALSYTTYGYRMVADTGTSKRYVYVAYGENPWQLWALNIDNGAATKLYEVTSTGSIAFSEISGQGWVATINTNIGHSDNVVTQWWCQDGALTAYSVGVAPPDPRDVHPLKGSLTSPPRVDATRGAGEIGWSTTGTNGTYAYVNYNVTYKTNDAIESLVTTPDGVMGDSASYDGLFRYVQASDTLTWFGAEGLIGFAQPLAHYDQVNSVIYFAGYPNGALYRYTPTQPYDTFPAVTNPSLVGYFGLQGIQFAGIKYVGNPATPSTFGALGNLLWVAGAGVSGRLYCAGTRDRNGTGAGIGYWDKSSNSFAGTFASPLDTVQPQGLVALDTLGYVVMSTNLRTPPGSAPLFVFDHNLTLVAQPAPVANLSNLGQIVPTTNTSVVCGVTQGSNSSLALWQYNVQTSNLIQYTELSVTGTLGCGTYRTGDGSYWCVVGSNLVRVDPSLMTAAVVQDLSAITPVSVMSFGGDGATLYLAGGADRSCSQLFSLDVPLVSTHAAGPPAHGTIRAVSARGSLRANQGRATIRKLS